MMGVSAGIPDFRLELVGLDSIDRLLEHIAALFLALVELRLRRGLQRSYAEVAENLPFVRGRISFSDDVRENIVNRQRAFCEYSDYTWDIPENQVIRQTARRLQREPFTSGIRERLRSIDRRMADVQISRLSPTEVGRWRYGRGTEDYRRSINTANCSSQACLSQMNSEHTTPARSW
jgi:5-methylcytosine-specific restriction enzyme subunit McrC